MTHWKVSYHLAAPVAVSNPVSEYPNLRISLFYDSGNNLIRVDHQLSTEDNLTADSVVTNSQEELKFFWELMHFQRGLRLQVDVHSAERLGPEASEVTPRTYLGTFRARAAICASIVMPDTAVFTNPGPRLLVWLHLANEARNAASSADAIRNYYMIWEDMHGTPARANPPTPEVELKFTRHFVSHGDILRDPDLLVFLQTELGQGTQQYDPTNPGHQALVQRCRVNSRNLIESELKQLIEVTV